VENKFFKFFSLLFLVLICSSVFAGITGPKIWGETKNKEGIIYIGEDDFASMEAKGSDFVGEVCEFNIYFAEGTGPLISDTASAVGDVCTANNVDVTSLDEGVYRLEVEKVSAPEINEDTYFAVVEIKTQPIPEILPIFAVLVVVVVAFIVVRKGKK